MKTNQSFENPYTPKVIEIDLTRFEIDAAYRSHMLDLWHSAETTYGTPGIDWYITFSELLMHPIKTESVMTESKTSIFDLLHEAKELYQSLPYLQPEMTPSFRDRYQQIRSVAESRMHRLFNYHRMIEWDIAANVSESMDDGRSEAVAIDRLYRLYQILLQIVDFYETVETDRFARLNDSPIPNDTG